MKKVIALLMLFSHFAYGALWCAILDPSGTNITTTYQNISFGGAPVKSIKAVSILNTSASEVWVNCQSGSPTVLPTVAAYNMPVPPGLPFSSPDGTGFGNYCWIKTSTGTLSAATKIYICVSGN